MATPPGVLPNATEILPGMEQQQLQVIRIRWTREGVLQKGDKVAVKRSPPNNQYQVFTLQGYDDKTSEAIVTRPRPDDMVDQKRVSQAELLAWNNPVKSHSEWAELEQRFGNTECRLDLNDSTTLASAPEIKSSTAAGARHLEAVQEREDVYTVLIKNLRQVT